MAKIEFVIPGRPKTWQRVSRIVKGNTAWNWDTSKKDKEVIGEYALEALRTNGIGILRGDIGLTVTCYGLRKRSDLDNVVKLIQDACNHVAFEDDSQIKEIHAYSRPPGDVLRTEIKIEEIPDLDF